MKKLLAGILCIVLILGMIPVASAATIEKQDAANQLVEWGLLKGTGTGLELDRAPTRAEALVMLIRLLGLEEEALLETGEHPFVDAKTHWANRYIAYAYQNQLTNGVSATKFGPENKVSAQDYITFALRALGYNDKLGDFSWQTAPVFSQKLGFTSTYYINNPTFLRADVALISYQALQMPLKNYPTTLAQNLVNNNVVQISGVERVLSSIEISSLCSPAVFFIQVNSKKEVGEKSTGSGFFISKDGVAVTNFHVLMDAENATIQTIDQKQYKITHILYYDIKRDIAVVRVSKTSLAGQTVVAFPYLTMGSQDDLQNGQRLYAIGSPYGLTNTISEGLCSNRYRILEEDEGYPYIQTSAAISKGSSGGALINEYGYVVGVTTSGYLEAQNLGFAVPIDAIKNVDIQQVGRIASVVYQEIYNAMQVVVTPEVATLHVGQTMWINIKNPIESGVYNIEAISDDTAVVDCDVLKNSEGKDSIFVVAMGIGTAEIEVSIYSSYYDDYYTKTVKINVIN